MGWQVNLWRATFREGWHCAECEHKRTIVMTPDGYPHDDSLRAPIPQRMCMVNGALDCPVVKAATSETTP